MMSIYGHEMEEDWYDDDEWSDRVERFADPGGESALYPATADNPRNLPCPTCGWPNRLTPADVAKGYQCNSCATALERGTDIDYYEEPESLVDQGIQNSWLEEGE